MAKAKKKSKKEVIVPAMPTGKVVAVVHYNTPELTEALVASLRKQRCDWPVVIFDNSSQRPFTAQMEGVTVVDNTKGQIIDIEGELDKFKEKQEHVRKSSNYASSKHAMSVQRLFDLLPQGFLLIDSDIILRRPVNELWDEKYAAVGAIQYHQPNYKIERKRLLPMLCYLNVPVLTANKALYFDPKRTFGLLPGELNPANWYDTGSVILEDIVNTKPALVAKIYPSLTPWYYHYQHGSWVGNNLEKQMQWLENHKQWWK